MLEKIEKIKEVPPLKHLNKEVGGFLGKLFEFLKEYAVIGIAIGVIFGQAAKDFVESMVKGFFLPLVQLIFPRIDFSNLNFQVQGVVFNVGAIVSTFLTLFIIVAILYFLVKKIIKYDNPPKEQEKNQR